MKRLTSSIACLLWAATFCLFVFRPAHADPAGLVVGITDPDRIGFPGVVETYDGTITNATDSTLNSADLFFNFSGYDFGFVTLDQLLGATDFDLAPGATSALVPLFTFTLGSGAPVPALFTADFTLESALGDLSDVASVSVRTIPEPDALALVGIGLLAAGVAARRRRWLPLVLAVGIVGAGPAVAQVSAVHFVTGPHGLAQSAGPVLTVALPIENAGSVAATNVRVTAATLRASAANASTGLPVPLGTIVPDGTAVFQADFNATALAAGTTALLTVRGSYEVAGVTAGFTVNRTIQVPPATSGSSTVATVTVPSQFVTGAPYPSQPVFPDDDVNETGPPVVTSPFVAGAPTLSGTAVGGAALSARLFQPAASVAFPRNTALGLTSGGSNGTASSTAEPSGGSNGTVVFVTTNWTANYSTDGGATFKPQIDPTTVFPADAIGFCCDQIVQYVPQIDRFVWLLQGNGYRLASASPAQLMSSGATAWTYWNLAPTLFGSGNTGLDYPDMAVGTTDLYLSWDAFCSPNCNGFQVARIPLSQIQAGSTISLDYTATKDSPSGIVWGAHLMQNAGNEIFWAGHNGNSKLQVYSLAEGSNTYFWRNVGIASWANSGLSSSTPDGQDWMTKLAGFPGNGIVGATRTSDQLWFGWSAGTDGHFTQPHVEIAVLDRANNFAKLAQHQVWNGSFAFAYPAFAVDACTGEIGFSMEYGGGGNYENHVVGFWGDFVAYVTTASDVGTTRFGDYVTIRSGSGNDVGFFDAFGYGLKKQPAPGTGTNSDVRYVRFGRPGGCVIQ